MKIDRKNSPSYYGPIREQKEIWLRQWQLRYEAFREARRMYLGGYVILLTCVAALLVKESFWNLYTWILTAFLLLLGALVTEMVFAYVKKSSERLVLLEEKLNMVGQNSGTYSFKFLRILQMVLWVGMVCCFIVGIVFYR